MKPYIKLYSLIMLCAFFLANITLAGCNDENSDEQSNELTPQELYQTSWRGTGHCAAWAVPNMEVGMQFIDTESGKVNWEGYDEIDISYRIEGKLITFNSNALYLGGAPWVIKNYTKKHITLIQNEASPDEKKVAIIELDRID